MYEEMQLSSPYKNLRLFNGIMGLLHLIQAVIMLAVSNSFTLPIYTNFLKPNPPSRIALPFWEKIYDLRIGPVVASFLLLSALAHFILVLPKVYEWYVNNLKNKINFARWYEYALSSSVMIVVIALLCGMYDLGSLILIFALNATMNLFGLMMELHNQTTKKTNWTAYVFGCFAGIVPWIVLAMYFFTAIGRAGETTEVPDFVYGIFYSLFIFFNIFALNMYLQYKQVGPWKNYTFGEKVYILLSLIAKSLLAWQVFGGTLRPS